jgi:hypothetical protein
MSDEQTLSLSLTQQHREAIIKSLNQGLQESLIDDRRHDLHDKVKEEMLHCLPKDLLLQLFSTQPETWRFKGTQEFFCALGMSLWKHLHFNVEDAQDDSE